MTGKRRRTVPHFEQKLCFWCHYPISERRPHVLLTAPDNTIVGPFHAGCAERLRLEAQKRPETNWLKGAASYGRVLPGREETLPW